MVGKIAANGIKLKADRLYKRLVCGGLILGCVSTSVFRVGILTIKIINMRELKFKFWNKKRKKMLNGEHDITKGMPMLGDSIWLQYTGMQDVNGTNVYEGDIIYNYDTKYYCEVKFIDGCWKTVYPKDTLQHKEGIFLLSHTLGNLYCVEGNIYENAIRIYGALAKN